MTWQSQKSPGETAGRIAERITQKTAARIAEETAARIAEKTAVRIAERTAAKIAREIAGTVQVFILFLVKNVSFVALLVTSPVAIYFSAVMR